MIAHLCRIVWNRRRANLLVAAELMAAFLVLFAVGSFAAFAWTNWRQPTGLAWQQVWDVEIDNKLATDDVWTSDAITTTFELDRAAREFGEVASVALAGMAPFEIGGMNAVRDFRGRRIEYGANEVSDAYRDVLGLEIVEGRWFSTDDDGQDYDPVVITQRMRDDVFGQGAAVGEYPRGRGGTA